MENIVSVEFVRARETLLDALGALETHRQAVILVGTQAVYLHTHATDTEFSVSPFTYDADIALDPSRLANEPKIVEAMQAAGFAPTV